MSKPGKSLKGLCKKLGVRLTVKRGKKRVYKSVKVLKKQCANKKKKKVKKKVKRKRRFGTKRSASKMDNLELNPKYYKYIKLLHDNNNLKNDTFDEKSFYKSLIEFTKKNIFYLRGYEPLWLQKLYNLGIRDFRWFKIINRDLKEGMVLRNCMLYFDPTDYFYITNVDFTGSTFITNDTASTETPFKYDLNADLNKCIFNECNLRNYVFVAQIIDCSFQGADLTGTNFYDCSITGTDYDKYPFLGFDPKKAFKGAIYNTKETLIEVSYYNEAIEVSWIENNGDNVYFDPLDVKPTRFTLDMERKSITPSSISTMIENNEEDEDGDVRLRPMKGYQNFCCVVGKADTSWNTGDRIFAGGEGLRWTGNYPDGEWISVNSLNATSVPLDEDVAMGGTVESKGGNFGKKRKRKVKKKVKRKLKVEKKVKRKRKVEKKVKRKRKVKKKVKRKK